MSDLLTYDNKEKTLVRIGDVVMVPGNIRAIVIGIEGTLVKILGIGTSKVTGETFVLQQRYVHDFPVSECYYMEKQTLSLEPSPKNLVDEVTQDGWHIVREPKVDMILLAYYMVYNQRCFDNNLPEMAIFWATSIASLDGGHANALYVSEESPVKRRYIVLDENLNGMFPLERLCLLHEMVHVKLEPVFGHGDDFIAEFKRVLDANHWEVLGCIDEPMPHEKSF